VQQCSTFAHIVPSEISYTTHLVEKAFAKMSQSDVDGIIIIFLSYSPSFIIGPVIKSRKFPVLMWNTQQLFEITKNFSSSDMMNNHGMHGVQDLASVLLRNNVPFTIITGHYSQEDTIKEVERWCKCAAICHDLKKLNIGRIGGRFKDMGDFSIPDSQITDLMGPKIIEIKMHQLHEIANSISPDEIYRVIEDENKKFYVSNDLDIETRKKSVRLELALRTLIDQHHLQALAINFMGFEGKNYSMPFAAISKFISEGMGYGGEGDVVCSTGVWILQQISAPASFTEMFTTDYKNNRILMSHMGESNLKM
ncbi:MAG: L-arabinose isomerase family protein, partial [Candidatus Ratteibacteria bacterium]